MSTIPPSSTVLVTGINGFIGSHIANQILAAGYNVRGTARTLEKGEQVRKVLEDRYGSGRIKIAAVKDMAQAGAFDAAIKDCSGVVHVASNLTFDKDPNKVIPEVIAGIKSILASAEATPSVKRFVYTSSSTACTAPFPNKKFTITPQTWNQSDIDKAWGPSYEGQEWAVYGASKTEAERALWKFMEDKNPHFVANAVLPNANLGPGVGGDIKPSSTGQWAIGLFEGKTDLFKGLPPQWMVDVRDTALLHLAGLVLEDVKSERIFAFAEPYNNKKLFDTIQKVRPEWKAPSFDFKDEADLSVIEAKGRAEEILGKVGKQGGFTGLEESLKDNLKGY